MSSDLSTTKNTIGESRIADMIVKSKNNYANRLAKFVLQTVSENKARHEALQRFFIANDSCTVATIKKKRELVGLNMALMLKEIRAIQNVARKILYMI